MSSKTRSIVAIIISVAVVGFATGMTIPLLSLRMLRQGENEFLIGCVAALPALGFVTSAPILHHLLRWCSRRQLVFLCFLASALSILLLKASADLRVWFPLRWIMGAASGIIVAIGEAWINELADDRKRGRIVASYTTTFTVCQLLGPLVIAMLGAASHWPILISTLLHGVVALFFLFLIKPEAVQVADEEGAQPLSIARFILHAPALCCGVLFFSFFDGTILSLFPVFGMHYGYSAAVAALMVSVILGGDAVLQLPLGWLADHMNRQRLHQYCGWLTLGLALALPWLMDKLWMLYPALVILGAAAGGIYTLALIQIGQIYRGNDLVTANAAAGMLWGVGSLIGPVFGGAALTLGRNGLPFTIAIAVLLFIAMSYAKPLSLSKVAPGE